MRVSVNDLLGQIAGLPGDWHGAGTVSEAVLARIAAEVQKGAQSRVSLETGAGRATLLLSNMFERHYVFALDEGGSLSRVRESSAFRPENTIIVEGPTQLTLPATDLPDALDFVLIDGPHGYPFSDLEYYHLYPRMRIGGLLVIDDIHIPSIRRMHDILASDDMWKSVAIVGTTAFLRRTEAPTTDPLGDEWWKQGYNMKAYNRRERFVRFKSSAIGRLIKRVLSPLRR